MKQHHLGSMGLVGALALSACTSDATNPPVLWLALDGSETKVKLQDHEPTPF